LSPQQGAETARHSWNQIGMSVFDPFSRSIQHPRAGVAVAFLLLAGSRNGNAQEALRSALSLDHIAQARQGTVAVDLNDIPTPHIGPVQMNLGVYTSAQYNDDVNYAEKGALADEVIGMGVDAGFMWPATPQSSVYLDAGVGYLKYLEHSQYDRLELSPNSVLNWDVAIKDVKMSFFDQFSYDQQVVSEPSLAGVAWFPLFNNTVGTRATWEPGIWPVSAGYSRNNYSSDSSTYEYLNRASDYYFARAGRRFAENTQVGLEASASVTRYDLAIQNGSTSYSGGGFAEWQMTRNVRITARGGPTIYDFQSNGRSQSQNNLSSYYASAQIEHNLTEFISHQFSVDRSVQLGLNMGSEYLQELKFDYSIIWQLTQSLTLNPVVSYTIGSQPWVVGSQSLTENYDQFGGSFCAGWLITKKLRGSLSYSYWKRESNLTGRNYADNALTLRLDYHF
jgi:hypothetical protein